MLIGSSIHGEDTDQLKEKEKPYNLSICAIFKNDSSYLKEWIEYHRIFGVDHFYLYNIESSDSYLKVLNPYVEEGLVTLVNWPECSKKSDGENASRWALSTQIPAYENAVTFKAKNETKWLILVDVDEFLVCPEGGSIQDLLSKYDNYSGISITSKDCFDTSLLDENRRKKLIIHSLYLTRHPAPVLDKSVTKMIFKPDHCIGFIWPPYQCCLKKDDLSISLDRYEMRINRYINRHARKKACEKNHDLLHVDNRYLSEDEVTSLLEEGYVIEDQERPIYQHIPHLLKKMGLR